ncbi:MAG: PKD domain-containing protein, partial [Flavobacteriales bacterium]|nr:PKD domain-containing protein [Flavobacteriales bacterium]
MRIIHSLRALLLIAASAAVIAPLSAQQYSITAGAITACSGVLEDSGGPAAQYGNNENFTVVICPDQPGDGISLTWAVFGLSTAGAQNTWDRIQIWDGNSTAATYLGSYSGSSLLGLVVSATTFNSTGCLTVQFTSNGTGTGDFAASITCFTPCERPEAVATMSEPGPALICVGETVDFDGTASYAAAGFNIVSYTWVFDDGSTATGPTASHSYTEPGEYIVQLNLIDDNDCVNSNVVDLQILVSTTPSFQGT